MEIALDEDQVALLAAVADHRVHSDPRFSRPDFERQPDGNPHHNRRATARLRPLKTALLVELVDEADGDGVRLYRLTDHGEQVLTAARAQAEPTATAPATCYCEDPGGRLYGHTPGAGQVCGQLTET
ncbi:hypothetical protein [Micromonospora sp. RTGN7]|uniref:hypothetical protein n=1 Tax=Micromonospora sp. RTGN7 TaxID=3016526 RepID=UPI0029FF20F8|nr:hypothetical protein [Micromonospora sp. RTGN7]